MRDNHPYFFIIFHRLSLGRRTDWCRMVQKRNRRSRRLGALPVHNLQGAYKGELGGMGHKVNQQHPSFPHVSHVIRNLHFLVSTCLPDHVHCRLQSPKLVACGSPLRVINHLPHLLFCFCVNISLYQQGTLTEH